MSTVTLAPAAFTRHLNDTGRAFESAELHRVKRLVTRIPAPHSANHWLHENAVTLHARALYWVEVAAEAQGARS